MSKQLKKVEIDTQKIERVEEFIHHSEILLGTFSDLSLEGKIKEFEAARLLIHDRRKKLEAKIKEVNLGERILQVGVVGSFSTGKSSFINSLLGEELLGVKIMPATAKITKLVYGAQLRIFKILKSGKVEQINKDEYGKYSVHEKENLSDENYGEIDHFRIEFNNPILSEINLIDTPGFSSISKEDDKLTKQWLKKLDVLLWLFDANKIGDRSDEILLKDFGGEQKIFGIINKIDLKGPSVRKKLVEELKTLYSFNEIFIYSAQKTFESTFTRNEFNQEWKKLFNEILDAKDTEKHSREISWDNKSILLKQEGAEKVFKITQIKGNEYTQYLSLLKISLDGIRDSQRYIFQQRLRDKEFEIEQTCFDVLQKLKLELERLHGQQGREHQKREASYLTFAENVGKMIDDLSKGPIDTLLNNLFKSLFGFRTENGLFSSSVKSYLQEINFDKIEPLINQVYSDIVDKSMKGYFKLIGKLKIDHYSDLVDKDSHKVETLYNVKNSLSSSSANSIFYFCDSVSDLEVDNKVDFKNSIIERLEFALPFEVLIVLLKNLLIDDYIDSFKYSQNQVKGNIENLGKELTTLNDFEQEFNPKISKAESFQGDSVELTSK